MTDNGSGSDREKPGFIRRAVRGASERVIDVIDPDTVLSHVDVNALLERIEVNDLLERADVDLLLDRIDIDALLDRIDIDRLVARIDVNALLARVEVNDLLDRIDVNRLVDGVDVDRVLGRVDVAAVADRIDVAQLVGRIDVDELVSRIDLDTLLERIDVRALVDRAGIPEIVAESTSHLTGSALDLFRRPVVGLDEIVRRALNRLVGRDAATFPSAPGALVRWADEHGETDEGLRTGRYAGPITRLLAFAADWALVTVAFTFGVAGLQFLVDLISGGNWQLPSSGWWYAASITVTGLMYLWLTVAVFGKTAGMAVMGARVVCADGSLQLQNRQSLIRAVTFPLSFVVFGVGLLGIVFGRERQAWHDHLAGTAVVYDWGSRVARMPSPLAAWLERREDERTAEQDDEREPDEPEAADAGG